MIRTRDDKLRFELRTDIAGEKPMPMPVPELYHYHKSQMVGLFNSMTSFWPSLSRMLCRPDVISRGARFNSSARDKH
jgi:hypothetical protein